MEFPYQTGRPYPLDVRPVLEGLRGEETFVLLETAMVCGEERTSYLFRRPRRILTAHSAADVPRIHQAMDRALAEGHWLAGWWAYEWGYTLEAALQGFLPHPSTAPLVWLGVFDPPQIWPHDPEGPSAPMGALPPTGVGDFTLKTSKPDYIRAIGRIKDYIAQGHTYQVNYTLKGEFPFDGDPIGLYLALRAQQAVSYGAVLRCGPKWILSLSPELFFRKEGRRIVTRPMKGTLHRGRTVEEDSRLARFLAADAKNRAENVMIVDLLRNDIGRIAEMGSVRVPELFTVERYETLFQMTSTIEGRLRPGIGASELFHALFPCGSVTGAPKIETMRIIAELEAAPRGVYTGAIGFLAPDGRGALNVAIRTVTLEGNRGEMGIGSGVTISSDAEAEYEECRLKARFLTQPFEDFGLIETLKWDPEEAGYLWLGEHLGRLGRSAHYFGFYFREEALRRKLAGMAASLSGSQTPHRVRLVLDRTGEADLTSLPVKPMEEPVVLKLASRRAESSDPFVYHKTTRRRPYDQALEEAKKAGASEALFVNERGEVAEGSFTNIFMRKGGRLITPSLECGLLPGVLREVLLKKGEAEEGVVRPEDLRKAEAIFVGNSVRGLLRAVYKA